jgi:hypothetical protein
VLLLKGFDELPALARGETGHSLRRADATSRKKLLYFDRPVSGEGAKKIADSCRAKKGRRVLYERSKIRLPVLQLFFEMAAGRSHFIGPDKCLASLVTGLSGNDALFRRLAHKDSLHSCDRSKGTFTTLPKEARFTTPIGAE